MHNKKKLLDESVFITNGVNFTAREVDVVSCIVHSLNSKNIASTLQIAQKTVESYIYNIFKKTSSKSQEDVRAFIIKSGNLNKFKVHYENLVKNKNFIDILNQIKNKIDYGSYKITVYYKKDQRLDYIISSLLKANIEIKKLNIKSPRNFSDSSVITFLDQDYLDQYKNGETFYNVFFICVDPQLEIDNIKDAKNINIIDCRNNEYVYEGILKILNLLIPHVVSKKIFDQLEDNRKNNKQYITNGKSNSSFKLVMTLILILLLSYIYYVNYIKSSNLSQNNSLIDRSTILNEIEKTLHSNSNIEIATLVGVGGAGKTTLARSYALSQEKSVVWELDASNKNTLLLSLEQLAIILCSSQEDRVNVGQLDSIDKLLDFVQKKLRNLNNWILIYDNVSSLKDIMHYVAFDEKIWGKGQVILITDKDNIKNIPNDNKVIDVGYLSDDEKRKLFDNAYKLNLKNDISTDEFLKYIESTPKAVLEVAEYLNKNKLNYGKYLELFQKD